MNPKRDGHVHTPFCPHGTSHPLEEYIEKAAAGGITTLTFAEHAPLPEGFTDTVPDKDSAMSFSDLEAYLMKLENIKKSYKNDITILTGLEVDYIEKYEKETEQFLTAYGPHLDDSILSTHFLLADGEYTCMDYSPEFFSSLVFQTGSADAAARLYYETVLLSVKADLGPFKPGRLGHMTLVHKFQRKFPLKHYPADLVYQILYAVKEQHMELDYNGAGTAKPLCREPYPPEWIIKEALKHQIPLVYGSDAHQPAELFQGVNDLYTDKSNHL